MAKGREGIRIHGPAKGASRPAGGFALAMARDPRRGARGTRSPWPATRTPRRPALRPGRSGRPGDPTVAVSQEPAVLANQRPPPPSSTATGAKQHLGGAGPRRKGVAFYDLTASVQSVFFFGSLFLWFRLLFKQGTGVRASVSHRADPALLYKMGQCSEGSGTTKRLCTFTGRTCRPRSEGTVGGEGGQARSRAREDAAGGARRREASRSDRPAGRESQKGLPATVANAGASAARHESPVLAHE